jgi:hypothetical protein
MVGANGKLSSDKGIIVVGSKVNWQDYVVIVMQIKMTRYSFQIFKLRILGFVELMLDCSCFNVSSFKFMLVLVTHPWA